MQVPFVSFICFCLFLAQANFQFLLLGFSLTRLSYLVPEGFGFRLVSKVKVILDLPGLLCKTPAGFTFSFPRFTKQISPWSSRLSAFWVTLSYTVNLWAPMNLIWPEIMVIRLSVDQMCAVFCFWVVTWSLVSLQMQNLSCWDKTLIAAAAAELSLLRKRIHETDPQNKTRLLSCLCITFTWKYKCILYKNEPNVRRLLFISPN